MEEGADLAVGLAADAESRLACDGGRPPREALDLRPDSLALTVRPDLHAAGAHAARPRPTLTEAACRTRTYACLQGRRSASALDTAVLAGRRRTVEVGLQSGLGAAGGLGEALAALQPLADLEVPERCQGALIVAVLVAEGRRALRAALWPSRLRQSEPAGSKKMACMTQERLLGFRPDTLAGIPSSRARYRCCRSATGSATPFPARAQAVAHRPRRHRPPQSAAPPAAGPARAWPRRASPAPHPAAGPRQAARPGRCSVVGACTSARPSGSR